jgi:ATP-dependent protease Clp ATPase subunit
MSGSAEWICSFCAHHGSGTLGVVAGATVFICRRCVMECRQQLSGSASGIHATRPASVPEWQLEAPGLACSFCCLGMAPEVPVLARNSSRVCRECVEVCEELFREQTSAG